ncbi:hybrid sensor histidine kinase/response regulator [Pseudomonas sp. 2(2015)]|uniref:hybrid sensor histidine kinase/response regulator n=1 Tax=Pseudomonas sp. 2(2015) TaxID=1619950 RepID=UPI0005EAEFED|nr:hybrid sensor histidine kinase/response regulator [Pseudomonas sp. 2(2015)]KJK20270.1 chemotaxis protein CheY [Pseudomonas sp. 2(2015)]
MKHDNALLEKLTRSSLRLNKGLMVLLGLALLLVGTSYWSFQRLIEEQHDNVRFHFARLMENIREQEVFLRSLAQRSHQGELLKDEHTQVRLLKALPEEGPNIYQGQEFSYSMPFSAKIDPEKIAASEYAKIFSLGAHLASFYSAFWSTSHYQSPHVFLFNQHGNFDITVPAAGHAGGKTVPHNETFVDIVRTVIDRLPRDHQLLREGEVCWQHYGPSATSPGPARMLAYIGIQLAADEIHIKGADTRVMIASILDLSLANDYERIMEWSIYDHFTLVAPSGQVLIGALWPESPLHEGINFKPEGLVFKLVNHNGPGWTAVYALNYRSFFGYALWPLASLGALLLAVVAMGWGANRWYRRQVILPARQAHASIAESEAFSRVVIDTAPTGLCVVRRADNQVLMENQRAQQSPGSAKLISALERRTDQGEVGETYLEIDGRHLQVGFVSTRYQGQDVRLYAFNDVTRHIEDATALEEARRAADAANEAKTLFLATMSHEIRTPLYGVLGTLELLGLTRLEPRQQEYLQTIQRSSATLFQLISDVLDVSKIESGQMAIEAIEFCPLDLIEDTLHTYAAFAQRKGLQLYACTDAALPERLLGDPMRIRQILNNLLSNAIKFTDTGRVVLRTRVLAREDDKVSLEWQVTDTGIGISTAQQAKLFELFYQVQDACSEGGAGLGLPICWWLSEMMGGQLKVVSEPGLGSSFALRMSLPVLAGHATSSAPAAAASMPVYVRAPVQELAQSLVDWLMRLGVHAALAPQPLVAKHAPAVLVDALPAANAPAWPGPRVLCTAGGRNPPEYTGQGWNVDLHNLRAIADAVGMARLGAPQASQQAAQQQTDNLQLRILVAEDNPINQAIIKEQLEALGCTAVVASNGEQALHLWQPEVFDLVLTDVNMPVMNGYELARTLREHDPQLPIIGVTANAMREEGMRCIAVGMNAWIVKPLSLQTLRGHLLKLCRPALHSAAVRVEPDTLTAPAAVPASDSLQLSERMRPLFISTMRDDLQLIHCALEQSDGRIVAQRLHSIAGALGAVQASELAEHCTALECRLAGAVLNASLRLEVQQILSRLAAVVDALE